MTVPTTTPKFLRSVPLGVVFTLGYNGKLLWTGLRPDKTYSENLRDYYSLEPGHFTEKEAVTVAIIHATLLGVTQ